jgi:hypothetical protein
MRKRSDNLFSLPRYRVCFPSGVHSPYLKVLNQQTRLKGRVVPVMDPLSGDEEKIKRKSSLDYREGTNATSSPLCGGLFSLPWQWFAFPRIMPPDSERAPCHATFPTPVKVFDILETANADVLLPLPCCQVPGTILGPSWLGHNYLFLASCCTVHPGLFVRSRTNTIWVMLDHRSNCRIILPYSSSPTAP